MPEIKETAEEFEARRQALVDVRAALHRVYHTRQAIAILIEIPTISARVKSVLFMCRDNLSDAEEDMSAVLVHICPPGQNDNDEFVLPDWPF